MNIDQLVNDARWKGDDDFGYDSIWNEEHKKWLGVADSHGQSDQYSKRLTKCSKEQRDETFAELACAYFLENRAGIKILQWSPNDGRVEFAVSVDRILVFCEVKSPGWEAEIIAECGAKPVPERLKQPKYLNGKGFAFGTESILIERIKKACPKFPQGKPALLIFADDFRISLLDDPLSVHRALYRQPLPPPYVDDRPAGYFCDRTSSWLTGVGFLNYNGLLAEYRFRYCSNHNSPDGRLLEQVFSQWVDADFPQTGWWSRETNVRFS